MKQIENFLSRISLIQKIFLIFFGCVIIPLVLQNAFYFTETEDNIKQEIYAQLSGTLENVANRLDASFSDALSVSIKYHNDARIYRCLDRNYARDMDYLLEYQDTVENIVKSDLPFHLQIDEVTFYSENPTLFNGALVQQVASVADVLTIATEHDGTVFPLNGRNNTSSLHIGLKYIRYEKNYSRFVSITRGLSYYYDLNQYPKALRVDLNAAYYNSLLSDTSLFANLLIVDPEGRVLFCANTYRQAGAFDRFDPEALAPGYILLEYELADVPLQLYGYYDSNVITDQFRKSMAGILLISGLGIGIAAVFLITIGRNLTRRTHAIEAKAAQIARGDFGNDTVQLAGAGDDEIAQIERSINQMSRKLQDYIDQEYSAELTRARLEKEVTQAKLQALQSQVNPHFLFNALESIRLNALDHDREETVRMIIHMSKMFRYLVDWQGDIVRLEQELTFLDEFLQIQQYRFGTEFSYTIDVQPSAKSCLLPKLILQPLVENACVHGVEATSNEKHIQIEVRIEEGKLIMRVADNGGGMSADRLASLQEMLASGLQSGNSVGLYNIYQRLVLQYRSDFSFQIDSQAGVGTVCAVTIPAQYAQDAPGSGKE